MRGAMLHLVRTNVYTRAKLGWVLSPGFAADQRTKVAIENWRLTTCGAWGITPLKVEDERLPPLRPWPLHVAQ